MKPAGNVVLLREVQASELKSGAFTLKNVAPGSYRLAVIDANGKLMTLQDVRIVSDQKTLSIKAP